MVVSTGYTDCVYQTREADGNYETGVNYEQTTTWPSLTDQQQMTTSLLGCHGLYGGYTGFKVGSSGFPKEVLYSTQDNIMGRLETLLGRN